MAKLKQSGAIVLLSLLILVAYYIFDQQDLVSVTEVARYKCLENQGSGPYLCISCISRKQFQVAKQSSIYVKDASNSFKVLAMPGDGLLTCQQLLQFASYELPMKTSADIKFQELGPIKQIIKLLKIDVTKEAVSKYEAPIQISSLAILQVKKQRSTESTIFTYSSKSSQVLARYFGKILAQCSLVFSLFCIMYYKCQHDQIKVAFLGVISINLMVLGQTMLSHSQYLLTYAISLTIGFYFTKGLVSRFLALIAIAVSLGTSVFMPVIYSEALVVLLVSYILVGVNKTFQRVGTFGIYCLTGIIICSGFKGHHHLLSLPLRMVIQYTILSLSPLLMEIVNNVGAHENYDKLPTNSAPSGVSLPGFEQGQGSEEED